MKISNLKPFLRTVALLCAVAGLLLCLNGCTKKPTDKATEPTTESTADTTPDTQPTTAPTTPPPTTAPVATEPTTQPSNCNHILGAWKVEIAASCTTEGSRYKECALCKEKVEIEVIPQLQHVASNWISDGVPVSCTNQGKQHQECSQCKEILFTITVDKMDHDTLTIDGYAATTTTPGRTDRVYCTECRKDVQESLVIPIVGSVEYTYQVTTYNTCTVTGVVNFTGDSLILPEKIGNYTITGISDEAFDDLQISTVYIPGTVTKIGQKAFYNCSSLLNITFQGTTAQWSRVQKGADWDTMTGNYTVYCSNQSVSK